MSGQTQIAAAFAAAGYKPMPDRLMEVAVAAWARYPGLQGTGARRDHVASVLRGEMTWVLIENHARRVLTEAIEALLMHAAEVIAAQTRVPVKAHTRSFPQGDDGGGQLWDETQSNGASAKSSASGSPVRGEGGSQRQNAAHEHNAPSLTNLADRHAAASQARLATAVRLSLLDTFKVNGQPIGDLTPREAAAWAASRERDARFVRLLTGNLPLDKPIRAYVDAATAEEMYRRAEKAE